MRIVHLTPHLRNVGNGIVNVTVDLACAQAAIGHRVTIVSAGGDFESLLAEHGVEFVEAPLKVTPLTCVSTAWRVRRILRSLDPDIVHVHLMAGAVFASLARVGLRFRLVSTVHTAFRRGTIIMGLADELIAVSTATADALKRVGIAARKIHLIFNAPLDSPRRNGVALPSPGTVAHPAIVTVAGLYRRKGIDVLISAFERVARKHLTVSLYVAGEGPDGEAFRRQATSSPFADRIHFLGLQKDPRSLLESADIFVLASRQDPFPLVIAEARAAGCAIVASAVDGIPEALEHGKRGRLFTSQNDAELSTILVDLLNKPEELTLWQAAAAENLDFYRLPRLVRDVDAVYDTALSTANRDPKIANDEERIAPE